MSLMDDLELIDRYVEGSLPEAGKIDFEKRLNSDEEFKALYTDSRQLDELIVHQQLHQIKVQIDRHYGGGTSGSGNSFTQLAPMIGVLIVVAGLVTFFIVNNSSKSDHKKQNNKPVAKEQVDSTNTGGNETHVAIPLAEVKPNTPGSAVISEEHKFELVEEPITTAPKEVSVFIDVDTVVPFPRTNKFPQTYGPLHENHYDAKMIETPELSVEMIDAHSQQTFTIVKLRVTNKTSDYLVYRMNETVFNYDFGNESAVPNTGYGSGNAILIKPLGSETKALKVSGSANHHVENLKLILNGFYRLSATGTTVTTPDIPVSSVNASFTTGGFQLDLIKMKHQFYKTSMRFNCTYVGSHYGLFNASKPIIVTKNNKEYLNEFVKDKTELLKPGESVSFTVEAQVYDSENPDEQRIVWNSTFAESKPVPLRVGVAKLLFDEILTNLKNK